MIEVLKQALEALERSVATCYDQYAHQQVMSQPNHFINQTITSLRQAIAELESQEPVPTVTSETGNPDVMMSWWHEPALPIGTKLYTHLPQRTWVGLDHHDKKKFSSWLDHKSDDEVFTAIEAKLKELNS